MNWSDEEVEDVPEGVVTVTSTVPADCGGLTAVICVAESTVKTAATEPKCTWLAALKLLPQLP